MYRLSVDKLSSFLVSVFAHGTIYAHANFNEWVQLMLDNEPEIMGRDSSSMDSDRAPRHSIWGSEVQSTFNCYKVARTVKSNPGLAT